MATPPITTETVQSLVNKGIEAAKAASSNKLDFKPASPGTVLLEGFAVIAAEMQTQLNELGNTIELNRLSLFGIERQTGTPAVGTLKVTLDGSYVEPFQLPAGYEIGIGGVTFETVSDLVIPAFNTEGIVAIAANLDNAPGTAGNLPADSVLTYSPPAKVATIILVDGTSGGRNQETDEEWKERVYSTIRRRDSLISERDFEEETIDQLGDGATALAVGRLKPDRRNYENGYVFVFALNPDGSQLNTAQVAQLQEALTRKAAMATISVDSLDVFDVDVVVYASFTGNAQAIAAEVIQTVNNFFRPSNLEPGSQVLNKALEYDIQNLDGIVRGVVAVTFNSDLAPNESKLKTQLI